MLIDCPEGCGYKVSDLALACPRCGFPVRERVALEAANTRATEDRSTRRRVGEADCPTCEARGFFKMTFTDIDGREDEGFEWCARCECTGRVSLCESSVGFFAVCDEALAAFLAGELDADADRVHFLGSQKPEGHRYPKPGRRFKSK